MPVGLLPHTSAQSNRRHGRIGNQYQPDSESLYYDANCQVYHLVGDHGADIAVRVVEGLCLVGLAVSRTDLAISTSHDDRTLRWPGKAGHCGRLDELVADHLLLPKVVADLVDEHNVVRLCNRQSVGFRAEGKSLLWIVVIVYFLPTISLFTLTV